MADSSSSSSSDDDSDDDFLALSNKRHDSASSAGGGDGAEVDREALVRKKLLENFYGKSAVAQAKPTELERADSHDDDADDDDKDADDDDDMFRKRRTSSSARKSRRASNNTESSDDDDDDEMAANDLDSPRFDAAAHTRQHVWHSTVHALLETEERLALQVRTLDSTMQTLVYENYSRFIDATDAIKSIGVNVQANEHGLHQLSTRLQAIDAISKNIEQDSGLGALRDQVAEKIRIQRLLTRLDALLKLPQTLQAHIAAGKYRTATQSYLSAASILGQHSQGFESLRTIETECTAILRDMKKTLVQKLLHWSGRRLMNNNNNDNNNNNEGRGDTIDGDDEEEVEDGDENENLLPKTMTEIFECSGTLCILLDEPLEDSTCSSSAAAGGAVEEPQKEEVEDALDADDLQSIAVAAASRTLDRILDTHMIQVQERRFSTPAGQIEIDMSNRSVSAAAGLDNRSDSQHSRGTTTVGGGHSGGVKGAALIPRDYLDALLEVATLYGTSFGSKTKPGYLTEFISEAYSSFLAHVEAILLEESALLATREEEKDDTNMIDKNMSENEEMSTKTGGDLPPGYYYEEISGALSILVTLARETASGLAFLSEVGMSPDYASSLVDRAVQLTDSMVRLRVDQKFYELRRKIVLSCLKPFCASAVALQVDARQKSVSSQQAPEQGSSSSSSSSLFLLPEIIPVARSTLSDCLQLVDDTIRSILATGLENQEDGGGGAAAAAASQDLPILKDAVRASTRRFAAWLANAIEILAGGESSNSKRLVEAAAVIVDDDNVGSKAARSREEDFGFDMPEDQDEYLMDLVDSAKKLLLEGDESKGSSVDEESLGVNSDFILALSEMCRLAERSVSENLEQSVATHLGSGGKKKSRGMFPSAGGDNVLLSNKNAKFW
jgi:vacuolar protein sorting-associated protein 51